MLTQIMNSRLFNNWKKGLGLFFLALSPLLITSCLDDDDVDYYDGPVAYVAYYHGSPETGNVSIYADGRLDNNNNFEYTDYFNYGRYFTGERTLSFKSGNAANSLLDTTVTLAENQAYSFFFIDAEEDADSDMGTLIAEDNWDEPSEGDAMIRLVHLSPDAPAVNLTINDSETPLFSNGTYTDITDFEEIDAEMSDFTLTDASTGEVLLTANDLNLRSQRVYTVVVRGYVNASETDKGLSLQVIRNYPNY
ncbi:DUF4397 domain-containing protein [Echinicola marina]|uniref:DUF4397 domain-containing protein n=1 Tax=Echinicola marina TaxID=2859768 RepID=UPI001CF65E2F|nr:DUF4397 domain-containing protein [Echinicola marina]UCS93800.1 DUF4397 domain-containing protein [Echinicola marina]